MKPGHVILRVLIPLLIGFSIACEEKEIGAEPEQRVVFEVNYANAAWFKQFRGFVIDKNGTVRMYENPAEWNTVKEGSAISASQMEHNLSQTSKTTYKIPPQLLEQYISLARDISLNYTKPAKRGADYGIVSYYAYQYDYKKQAYTPVLLGQTGDVEIFNTDKNAVKIMDWLSGIYQQASE